MMASRIFCRTDLQFLIGLQNLYICAVYLVFILQVKKRVRILTCDKNSTTFLDENCSRKTAHLLSRLSDNKKIKSLSFSLGNTCSNVTDCEMEPEADPGWANAGIHTAQIPLDTSSRQVVSVCIFFQVRVNINTINTQSLIICTFPELLKTDPSTLIRLFYRLSLESYPTPGGYTHSLTIKPAG